MCEPNVAIRGEIFEVALDSCSFRDKRKFKLGEFNIPSDLSIYSMCERHNYTTIIHIHHTTRSHPLHSQVCLLVAMQIHHHTPSTTYLDIGAQMLKLGSLLMS